MFFDYVLGVEYMDGLSLQSMLTKLHVVQRGSFARQLMWIGEARGSWMVGWSPCAGKFIIDCTKCDVQKATKTAGMHSWSCVSTRTLQVFFSLLLLI